MAKGEVFLISPPVFADGGSLTGEHLRPRGREKSSVFAGSQMFEAIQPS